MGNPVDLDGDALLVKTSPTLEAIDSAIASAIAAEEPRKHLGFSQIGKHDERTLWLQFRWCLPADHAPRTERIFRLGDAVELELARYLRMVPGIELHTADADGKQFRFSLFGDHFAGAMDGALFGIPEAPKTWHVWESKSVSRKRFAELKKVHVKKWSPEYYGQLQCYMGASGMDRALFMAYCKDDSEIYAERVRFDPMEWDALQTKALRILESPEPPASSYRDPTWYEARWMGEATADIYWKRRFPANPCCRNCRFSAPVLTEPGAQWVCNSVSTGLHMEAIPPATVAKGCEAHQWIHALSPLEIVGADEESTRYKLPHGGTVANGPSGYSSRELAEASKTGFEIIDQVVETVSGTMNAKLVHAE